MERKYQVFVSSTYQDLVEERREVIQALLEMDCLPAGMEMFPAANEDQWTLIKEVIDECDYYIVIVGGRYGSTSAEGISFTEMEYDYAVEQGIPVMGFVHANPDDIPKGKSEMDSEAVTKLDLFREKVMSRMVKQYESPAELGSVVSRGLVRLTKRNPRPGWVRGDYAMTAETRAEIAELRATIASLEKSQVERTAAEGLGTINEEFEHGADEAELQVELSGYEEGRRRGWSGIRYYKWDEIISVLGPSMIDEAPETVLRRLWNDHVEKDVLKDETWPSPSNADAKVTDQAWGTVIVQLRALGVIATGIKKRSTTDKAVYWRLTPAGDDYLVNLTAVRRGERGDD